MGPTRNLGPQAEKQLLARLYRNGWAILSIHCKERLLDDTLMSNCKARCWLISRSAFFKSISTWYETAQKSPRARPRLFLPCIMTLLRAKSITTIGFPFSSSSKKRLWSFVSLFHQRGYHLYLEHCMASMCFNLYFHSNSFFAGAL